MEMQRVEQLHNESGGVIQKIRKLFEARYTVGGRMLLEQAKLEKIQGSLSKDQQTILFDRLQKSVRNTIITDAIIGSAVVVGGVLLIKNRQRIGESIKGLVGREVVELSPEQWAERIKVEAKHIGIIGSLKDQEYHAGSWIFRGKYQGNINLAMDDKLGNALTQQLAGSFPKGVPEGAKVVDILDAITHRWEEERGYGVNKLYVQPRLDKHLDPKRNLAGIAYAAFADPKYFEGYEFPGHGLDDRMSPLIVQMLVPRKLAQSFEAAVDKKPNVIHEVVSKLLHGLFDDFGLVKADTLHVYGGGLPALMSRLTKNPHPKILQFSPPVGSA